MPTEETMIEILKQPTTSSDPEKSINKSLSYLPVVETALNLKVTVN